MPVSSPCVIKETLYRHVYPSREQHTAGDERAAPGLLVPRAIGHRSPAGEDESPGAPGLTPGDLPRFARTAGRPTRYLPPPGHAPLLRTLRRRPPGMLLSRLAVRYGGALPAHPGLGGRITASCGQNRRHDLSLRRTRRVRLGLPG